jgi:RHS repeat-associated protein
MKLPLLTFFASLLITSSAIVSPAAAQPCDGSTPLKPDSLLLSPQTAHAVLIGFNEFGAASTPPRKFRRRQIGGTLTVGNWGGVGCPVPVYGTSYSESGSNFLAGDPYRVDWSASFVPVQTNADGSVTWRATTQGFHVYPPTGASDPIGVFIAIGGAQYGNFDDRVAGNGDVVTLPRNASAPYTIYAFSNSLFGASLPSHGVLVMGPLIAQTRDVWDEVREYDGTDPTGTRLLIDDQHSTRYVGAAEQFPFSGGTAAGKPNETTYAGLVTETLAKTSRRVDGTNACRVDSLGTRQASGRFTTELLVEDTDEDAEKRLVYQTGTSAVAYRTTRTTGFAFDVARFNYAAKFRVPCRGEYTLLLHYTAQSHGSTGPGTARVLSSVLTCEEGLQTVLGAVAVRRGDPNFGEFDVDYTFTGLELQALCPAAEPASVTAKLGSVQLRLGLGKAAADFSAGELRLDAAAMTPAIYDPAALTVALHSDSVTETIRTAAGTLRQVKSPQTFADIVPLASAVYEVRFYSPDQVGVQDAGTKIYALSGDPFASVRIENPDAAAALANRLRISESRGGVSKVSDFAYDAATSQWTLSAGGGLREESLVIATVGTDTVKTTTVRAGGGAVASRVARTYRALPWGDELVREIDDPDGSALKTELAYYDVGSGSDPNYRHLRQRTDARGGWERFSYDADGRILKTIRPFLNTPPDTTNEALCRIEENSYDSIPDRDGDGLPEARTTTVERVLGQETARRYEIEWSRVLTLGADNCKRRTEIRAISGGGSWDAPENITTDRLLLASGVYAGRERRRVNPDGTAVITTRVLGTDGQLTTIVSTGQPNAACDQIIAGQQTSTVMNASGQTISTSVRDIGTGLTLSTAAATEFDSLGRPVRTDYENGTYTTQTYACCGLASQRDANGIVTTYSYDALGRMTDVSRGGIRIHTEYDAAGRVLSVSRIGSDGSQIVQEQNRYDVAGRLIEQRDAMGRLSRYVEIFDAVTGCTTRTTTKPDGGTMIEVLARDGSLLSVSGSAAAPRLVEYGVDPNGLYTRETLVGADENGAATNSEWVKTVTDFAGRLRSVEYADGASTRYFYNAADQLVREVDPDGVTTLYGYNALGAQEVVAIDLNGNNAIDYAGPDRVVRAASVVTAKGEGSATYTVQQTTTSAWELENVAEPTIISIDEQTTDGQRSWRTSHGLTMKMTSTPDGVGGRTVTTIAPDGVKTVQLYQSERLQSQTTVAADGASIAGVSCQYDAHGRLATLTDARNGAATYTYYADDRMQSVTTPDPDLTQSGPGYDAQTTTYVYDAGGRIAEVTEPDGGKVYTTYWPTGALQRSWGARTFPTEFTYDPQGRTKTVTTWQNFAADEGRAVTSWEYDPRRGFLRQKRYADGTGPTYGYRPSGRLWTRTWARTPAITTTYGYTAAGELASVDYSDATPDVSIEYDRAGRQHVMRDGAGVRTMTYHASGQLENESYAGGVLDGIVIRRSFDALDRQTNVEVPGTTTTSYNYDAASRLKTVSFGANTATYGYASNSNLVESITFQNAGLTRLTTAKAYDRLGRLSSISHAPSASPAISYVSTFNGANQRVRTTREDESYWSYDYDPLGQVVAGSKFLPTGEPVRGSDYRWTFDDIGNRRTATPNAAVSNYTANALNQYTQRTVPRTFDVTGAAAAGTTVSVTLNGGLPQSTTRQGELFYRQLPVGNTAAAETQQLKITAVKSAAGLDGADVVTTSERNVFVPSSPETFAYDADGNLTADASWRYTWDAENRLVATERNGTTLTAEPAPQRIELTYDGLGRRVAKKAFVANGTGWEQQSETRFIFDGWNLQAEVNGLAANAPARTFAWGSDLSGAFQDAGGVAGLLFSASANISIQAYGYDATGNVGALVAIDTGLVTGRYDYNAFGEVTVQEGPSAAANPFRYSTKWVDDEAHHSYFGYRCYDAATGRWLNRDPYGEDGGANLYQFAANAPTSWSDPLGLALYAFDGTNNDGERDRWDKDTENGPTNVKVLYDIYAGPNSFYAHGVGTRDGLLNVFGLAGGLRGKSRERDALRAAADFIKSGDTVADIIGFSRGAAEARDFANLLKAKYPCVRIRWIGIFDTVASFGLGGNDVDLGYNFGIPAGTGSVFHLTAAAERRHFFPLMSINVGADKANPNRSYTEISIPGAVHSDIGGGYREDRGLANLALLAMWRDGRRHDVPFGAVPSRYLDVRGNPHDSRWKNDKVVEFVTGGPRQRKVFFAP